MEIVYCGRGSALGNPFPITAVKDRDHVCDEYAEWFPRALAWTGPQAARMKQQLDHIVSIHKKHGKVGLKCFCAPKRCHVETIKQHIEENML
jgi:hypothetical protein